MPRGKPFAKGNKGRPEGAKNKVTQSIRQAFKDAFDEMGGVDALVEWGKQAKNRTAFYMLAAKLIPIELSGEVKTDGKLTIEHVIIGE